MNNKILFNVPELEMDVVLDFTTFEKDSMIAIEYDAEATNYTEDEIRKVVEDKILEIANETVGEENSAE